MRGPPRRPFSTIPANRPKPEPRNAADVGDDQQRVAQVGLVGAVFEHRLLVGMRGNSPAGVTALAVGEFLEHAGDSTGSIAANTSSCVTKLISKSSW
jgi:hypothetical protein